MAKITVVMTVEAGDELKASELNNIFRIALNKVPSEKLNVKHMKFYHTEEYNAYYQVRPTPKPPIGKSKNGAREP